MSMVDAGRPPHLFWTLTEGRAVFELGAFRLFGRMMRNLPRGDGHPVLVLPGFMASDRSTRPMRSLLNDLGYDARPWGLGQNVRFNAEREEAMSLTLSRLHEESGEAVSIIGWSLGGVFARELAKQHPDKVRQVITLGSPISGDRNHSSARHVFEAINGKATEPEMAGRYQSLNHAPPVPTTSIFTRTDGIVSWQGSLQHRHNAHADVENIEVPASHVGLGVNPLVMVIIADRLAQTEGEWTPFDPSGWRSLAYKLHH
ncbi:MAG: alpha/beta hydrolase [Hyphomonas sp.]|nr:alpha/beta hydrolase [Hyphomonas sp.]